MSLAHIRSMFESTLAAAYGAMTPAVPVMFDNVQETPPAGEYVVLSLSFPSISEPTLCLVESGIEYVRGNVQVACYVPRAQGMKRLEQMTEVAMMALNSIQTQPDVHNVRPRVGAIRGPVPVLSGDSAHALANVSAPFVAKG